MAWINKGLPRFYLPRQTYCALANKGQPPDKLKSIRMPCSVGKWQLMTIWFWWLVISHWSYFIQFNDLVQGHWKLSDVIGADYSCLPYRSQDISCRSTGSCESIQCRRSIIGPKITLFWKGVDHSKKKLKKNTP